MTTFANRIHRERLNFIRATNPNFLVPVVVMTLILLIVVILMTNYSIQRADFGIGKKIANRITRSMTSHNTLSANEISMEKALNLEELNNSFDNEYFYEFFAIVNDEGKFIWHSDNQKLGLKLLVHDKKGQNLNIAENINLFLNNTDENGSSWGYADINGENVFLVHRYINLPENKKSHIFVAVKPEILEQDFLVYRDNIFNTSILVFTIGVFVVWLFLLTFRFYISKRRVKIANEIITDMNKEVHMLKTEVQKHERLGLVSGLAAGIAHELRNPLSSIKGYATYFQNQFTVGSANHEATKIMITEVERLNKVIKDLINVARPIELEEKLTSLSEVINYTIQLLAQDAGELGVQFILTGKDKYIPIDSDKIKQALLNIFINALEAFKENDYIYQMQEQAYIKINLVEGPSMMKIHIKNNATPIDPQNLKQIFYPYFTTKSSGTGLGLVMVTKIIEAHNGSISVQSHKKIGTLFNIQLPKVFKDNI